MCPLMKVVRSAGGRVQIDQVDTGERRLNASERSRLKAIEEEIAKKAPEAALVRPPIVDEDDSERPLIVTAERAKLLEQHPAPAPASSPKAKASTAKKPAAKPAKPAAAAAPQEPDPGADDGDEIEQLLKDELGADDDEEAGDEGEQKPTRFPCTQCPFTAGSEKGLAAHIASKHGG